MPATAATKLGIDPVSSADATTFARDGAVCVRGVLDREWLARLSGLFDSIMAHGQDMSGYYGEGQAGKGKTVVRINGWHVSPPLLAHLQDSPLPRAAAAVLGSRQVRLYEDLIIHKSPGAEQPTPWHQDEPQWPVSGLQMASAWFCLDPVTPATGALRIAVGSHRGPLYRPFAPPERAADHDADAEFFEGGALPDVDADPRRFPVRSFDINPGDVLFFHPRVLHAAYGSAPAHSRRTFSIRFLGDDVRWLPKQSVFYESLGKVTLQKGDPISGDSFPAMWPQT
jgi:ectoine hydroxylase-related dioxygenase (phytanoyl-CoA dioxygenase family)